MVSNEALLIRLEAVEDAFRMAFDSLRKLRVELCPGPLTPLGLERLNQVTPIPAALQIVPPDSTWIPILHAVHRPESSLKPCGQVGLYLTDPPREHEKASLERMRILVPGEQRWREPTPGDIPLCSSCGIRIDPFSNADLDYLSHMIPGGPAPRIKRGDRGRSGGEPPQVPPFPGGSSGMTGSPSTFPGHTFQASQDVLADIAAITELAQEAGLLDDRRLPQD